MELSELLVLVRKGDELAWECFVRRFQGRVLGLAFHYTGHAEEARDLAQDVFVRVFQHLNRIPDAEGCVPWMLRITRNACIDHLRRRKARPHGWDVPIEGSLEFPAGDLSPEEVHALSVRSSMMRRALQDLSDISREIIILKELQGLEIETIARILGIPAGTVKSRSNRARLELADLLVKAGLKEGS